MPCRPAGMLLCDGCVRPEAAVVSQDDWTGASFASRPATHHVKQAPQDALAVGPQAVVGVLVGDPGPQPAYAAGRLLGKGSLHVDIVDVHRRRYRDLVAREAVSVVQARPCMLRQKMRRVAVRTQS